MQAELELAGVAIGFGLGGNDGAHFFGQAGNGGGFDVGMIGVGGVEHMVREVGGQLRQLFLNGFEALLLLRRQLGPAQAKVADFPFQQALLHRA